jgi:hypothetical protein
MARKLIGAHRLGDYNERPPVVVPRWLLTLKYSGFIAIGIAGAWAGSPVLTEATSEAYTARWGLVLAVSAVIAAIASLRKSWEVIERWSSLILVAVLSIYTWTAFQIGVIEGDSTRTTLAAVLATLTMLPAARAFGLLMKARWPWMRKAK